MSRNSITLIKSLKSNQVYCSTIKSTSMLPLIKPGDNVCVKKTSFKKLKIGDIALVSKKNKIIAHRIIKKINKKSYKTKGDNCLTCDSFNLSKQNYLGKVIKIKNKNKKISLKVWLFNLLNYTLRHKIVDNFLSI